jgi:hypothetical protein
MRAEEIKVGEVYYYQFPQKMGEYWECVRIYFNESQNQWLGQFKVLTDPYKCNRIGTIQNFNEIEIERYIYTKF